MAIIKGLQGFAFRGKHSSEFGIILNSTKRSILPQQTEKLVEIPGRPGAHSFGKQIGVREISLDITIEGKSQIDLNSRIRKIASWLKTDVESELVFDKEPGVSYYGFFTGTSDLDELMSIASTTLTFLCPDPYAYGIEKDTKLLSSPHVVNIDGNEETYPAFKVTFKEPSTFFTVGTKNKHVFIGANKIDAEVVAADEKVLAEPMSSVNGWVQHSTLYPDTTVSGSFKSNGYSFSAADYGTGKKWHGPALKKMASRPVQDFRFLAHVGMFTGRQSDFGKVEVHLLDANSNSIGRLALFDDTGYAVSRFQARVGSHTYGKTFADYTGDVRTSTVKYATTSKVNGKDVTTYKTTEYKYGALRDFKGDIEFERVGRWWLARITKVDNAGKAIWSYKWRYHDAENKFSSKVAGAVVHVAAYGTHNKMSSLYVARTVLWDLNPAGDNQVKEIFDKGDELHISCETGSVLLNGQPFTEQLDFSSEFFSIAGGNEDQEIAYQPFGKCDVIMSHRPRYL